jgi:acyl-CoA synthetase (AMP-forming)/AMP-acid ligase II
MAPFDIPAVPFAPGDDIASIVARIARHAPDRVALIDGERRLTYRELDERVTGVAGALARGGVGPGKRAAILAQNSLEYVEAFFGVLRAGASVVPLPTMASAETLELLMADSGSSVLFASEAYRELAERLGAKRPLMRVGLDFEGAGFTRHESFREAAGEPFSPPPVAAGDEFDVIYSSGTTGVPKGIVHGHGARKASYAGSRAKYFAPDTVNLVTTPFYSNTTCVTWLLATAAGGTNVVLRKFSPDAFFDAASRHRATHAMLVPVQYERLLSSERLPTSDVSSLRYLFSTSAPLRAETKRRILEAFSADLVEIYALTEGGPATILEARRHPDKLASVGAPTGSEVRVVDETGADVPPGRAGEIIGRSATMTSGYLNRPEETERLLFFDANGATYFRTGDVGRFDEDGFLHLLDRKKDVIISGGFNVYATDIEAVLATHPDVAEVAVIGVPSERWGETPLALVVPKPESRLTPGAVLEYGNARLGKLQRVSAVELRPELPKNAIGKVLKRELRAPYWTSR